AAAIARWKKEASKTPNAGALGRESGVPTTRAAAPSAPPPTAPPSTSQAPTQTKSTSATQPRSNVPPGARSVKDFGAKANGSTDDTAAIQRAIDAGPGTVFLPAGAYLVAR